MSLKRLTNILTIRLTKILTNFKEFLDFLTLPCYKLFDAVRLWMVRWCKHFFDRQATLNRLF